MLYKIFARVRAAVYPVRCVGCDRLTVKNTVLCNDCRDKLQKYDPKGCKICGVSRNMCVCDGKKYFSHLCFCFFYEGTVAKQIAKAKFNGRYDLLIRMARLMAQNLADRDFINQTDVITYMPMTLKAKRKRGYNQAKLLATEIGRIHGIPVRELAYKTRETASQHKLNGILRTGNLLGAFEPYKKRLPEIEGKNILIVDDIITGGSTVGELAKTLLIFSANEVNIATIAAGRLRIAKNKKHSVADKPLEDK